MRVDGGFYIRAKKRNQTIRELKSQLSEIEKSFYQGLKEIPEPIPESEIMALFEGS
jgi:hypothetical protein